MTPMAPSNANNDGCKLGRFNGGTCIEMGLRFDFPQVNMMVLQWFYTNYSIYIHILIYIIHVTYIYIYIYTLYICD